MDDTPARTDTKFFCGSVSVAQAFQLRVPGTFQSRSEKISFYRAKVESGDRKVTRTGRLESLRYR